MIIKKNVFVLLFLSVFFGYSSYAQNYNAIDSIVLKYPKNFSSIKSLATRIQEDFTSEHDKARAIYSWVALNINYDYDASLNSSTLTKINYTDDFDKQKKIQLLNQKTFEKAFRSKKAVCEGFSLLYDHLALLVGLKSQVIRGDSKTKLIDIGRKNIVSNHTWNKVLVDGKWILVDATWGSGYYDFNKEVFVEQFSPIYFDTNPEYFSAKHFAESGNYIKNKGNKDEFLNGPLIYNKTIEGDHEVLVPDSGVVQANDGDKVTFKIKNISKFDNLYYVNKKNEEVKIENPKEIDGALEFKITYNKKMGRFVTFYLYQKSIASFKVIPK
jgi:hypothetical protein